MFTLTEDFGNLAPVRFELRARFLAESDCRKWVFFSVVSKSKETTSGLYRLWYPRQELDWSSADALYRKHARSLSVEFLCGSGHRSMLYKYVRSKFKPIPSGNCPIILTISRSGDAPTKFDSLKNHYIVYRDSTRYAWQGPSAHYNDEENKSPGASFIARRRKSSVAWCWNFKEKGDSRSSQEAGEIRGQAPLEGFFTGRSDDDNATGNEHKSVSEKLVFHAWVVRDEQIVEHVYKPAKRTNRY